MRRGGPADAVALRGFGLLIGGVLSLLAIWPLILRDEPVTRWAIGVSSVLLAVALVSPRLLRWPYAGWMAVGQVLGWINTRIVLGLVFYGLLTPVALAMRLGGYDPLLRGFDAKAPTYRVPVGARDARHMARRF